MRTVNTQLVIGSLCSSGSQPLANARTILSTTHSQPHLPINELWWSPPIALLHRERQGDLQAMVDGLRAQKYTALILDAPVLEYVTGTNEACDLFTIGEVFETFSLALAFPPAADDAMVFDFSKSIVSLQVRWPLKSMLG